MTNELANQLTFLGPDPVSDSAALMQVIARAAENPAVDLDKMERLLQMHQRIMERTSKIAYAVDMAAMQPLLPIIAERGAVRNKLGEVQSTYALWEDLNEAIKPILAASGFSITFRIGQDDGRLSVTGVLLHRAGHSEETTMVLPIDMSGSKNAVQAVGSSTSYGKRYTAGALLNITSRGGAKSEDDDGKSAGGNGLDSLGLEQIADLENLIVSNHANKAKFLKLFGVPSIPEIPLKRFLEAVALIQEAGREHARYKNARGEQQ
jgi:hypothetical protein